jgi:predicted TIM-barrel fold metal-dependent hydrolase
MRLIAIEEHYRPAELSARIAKGVLRERGWPADDERPGFAAIDAALNEAGEQRLSDMDRAGISMQLLSLPGAGAELLQGDEGIAFARHYNDRLHRLAEAYPDRFGGFCHLPLNTPEAAADELERSVRELGLQGALVNGTTNGLFLDHPRFRPLLARAAALDVPIYIHPSLPPRPVLEAYYSGLPGVAGFLLACPGFGWHAEAALHVLRLAIAGAFDLHPGLKIIVGHLGEGLATILDRADEVFASYAARNLTASVGETIRSHVWITMSGFFSPVPFQAALAAFGIDRILFAVDYPFSSNIRGAQFLRNLPLSEEEKQKIACRNAQQLFRLPKDDLVSAPSGASELQ